MKNPLRVEYKMAPGLLINGVGGGGVAAKKRVAPQPPKPVRSVGLSKNKVDDSYSTMSTVSANSTISEKSIKVNPKRQPLPRNILPVEHVVTGWIRVHCGPQQTDNMDDDPNKVLQINVSDTVKDIVLGMDLPVEYTMWLQIAGVRTRRLQDDECPLVIQELFLKKLGYHNELRRLRMGIDPDLKYLLRFHIGPTQVDCCRGVTKSGQLEILKGLVSPQWKSRAMCIIGSKLNIFPGRILFIVKFE